MSKTELLTTEETAEAATQGWGLHYVFNLPAERWTIDVLPTQFNARVGAAKAKEYVMSRALSGQPLCVKAMRLITEFNQSRKKPR